MKKTILAIATIATLFSCSQSPSNSDTTKQAVVSDFLSDISSLEEQEKPIKTFVSVAQETADKVVDLDKTNIKDVLETAHGYQHLVIVTGNHTIVNIEHDELNNCKQSGSWGACMPYAEGYIKKGDLVFQEGYINNIIGTPDDQERVAYFFGEM